MPTFGDFVTITNNGTADNESAASTISIQPNSTIYEITVQDLTVGHTYAVKVNFPGINSPQNYLATANGAAGTNGGKLLPCYQRIAVSIPVGQQNSVNITTFADTASATVKVGLVWTTGGSGTKTFSDYVLVTVGTTETSGTINVPAGAHIKKITYSSRLSIGLLEYIRVDCSGIATPQKYLTMPMVYDAVGTEVEDTCLYGGMEINVDIVVPPTANTITVYGLSQTASNTCAIGLVWV